MQQELAPNRHFENPWLIFKRYNDVVDGQCARDMLAKWENKLG